MAKITMIPIGDRVVVRRDETESKTPGGLVLPEKAKQKATRGTVVAVGAMRMPDDGRLVPLEVPNGARVLFGSYDGVEVEVDGKEYTVLRVGDLILQLAE